jgi:hypothetical protein
MQSVIKYFVQLKNIGKFSYFFNFRYFFQSIGN